MGHLKFTRRTGFTIIELLMVITVISLMTTLLVGASYRFVVGAREAAAATTITKASSIIDDRVRAFRESDFTDAAYAFMANWNANATAAAALVGPTTPPELITPALAEVIVRKARFRGAFPQTFTEMSASQKARFFGSSVTFPLTSPPYDSKYEPGIVLYALLLKGETFGAPTPGDDAFIGAEVRNGPETGGLPCLVDAWGEPLRFYRWPTRLIKCGEQGIADYNLYNGPNDPPGSINLTTGQMQASPAIRPTGTLVSPTPASLMIRNLPPFDIASAYATGPDGAYGIYGGSSPTNTLGWPTSDDPEYLNTDPDDPSMSLYSYFYPPSTVVGPIPAAGRSTAFVIGSQPDPTGTYYVDAYHDPFTFSTPLIVSAGPDKQLGLWEPADIPTPPGVYSGNFGYLAAPQALPASLNVMFDNITNLNQRAGGK